MKIILELKPLIKIKLSEVLDKLSDADLNEFVTRISIQTEGTDEEDLIL